MLLLDYYKIDVSGLYCVIVGRSDIVGKPLAMLLSNKLHNATVTLCHSKTKNVIQHLKLADLIIIAIGQPEFLTKDMIKPGAIIIDVGINYVDGKIVGDVGDVGKAYSYLTPVPKGVGPMTIAALMKNTFMASQK